MWVIASTVIPAQEMLIVIEQPSDTALFIYICIVFVVLAVAARLIFVGSINNLLDDIRGKFNRKRPGGKIR